MIRIFTEPLYANSLWCEKLKESLISELKKKRKTYQVSENPDDAECFDTVFLVSTDYAWIGDSIANLNKKGIQPILICNQTDEAFDGLEYNCVCSDIYGSMQEMASSLLRQGKEHTAIYGVNKNSSSDICRMKCLKKMLKIGDSDVFYNNGSLADCFGLLQENVEKYDSVICVNDLVAVSLIRHLHREHRDVDMPIYSCLQSEISLLYRESINSLQTNYSEYGKAAVYISEFVHKNPYTASITVRISGSFGLARGNTAYYFLETRKKKEEVFYADPEVKDMICAEKIMSFGDQTDKMILHALASDLSYDAICERCFLTENAVRYRIKRLVDLCHTEHKRDLIRVYREYWQQITN